MNALPNRRDFLKRAALLLPAATIGMQRDEASAAVAPIRRAGGSYLKTSLNAYSFSGLLDANAADPKQGLDLFQLCDFSAKQEFDAVDLTGYFFPGYPKAPDDKYIFALKRHAFDRGLAISGSGVKNDFTTADKAIRAEGVQRIKEWVEVSAKLGAPVLRVFADTHLKPGKWRAVSEGATHDQVEAWIAEAVHECAEHAQKFGVIIGVQNHGDFISTGEEHLSLLKHVDHEWCGAIVDTGKYVTADPYADIALMAPYACNWQIKESPFGSASKPRTDMIKLLTIIRRSGYRGYLPIETLSMGRKDYDPVVETSKLHAELREAIKATESIAPDSPR
jgi:sugar phosphate isomerase/epimerase